MTKPHVHATHPALIARLKRADGHLRAVIGMIEEGKPCLEIAQQLQAVEKGVPFMPLRGIIGSDLLKHRSDWQVIDNPFAEAGASRAISDGESGPSR